jgi:quercetin dioxygenase-like cupin family protein
VPGGVPHGIAVTADATYYVMKDTRAPFGDAGLQSGTGEIGSQTRNATGAKVQYVYDIAHLDAVPEGRTSSQVVPRNFISGKSSSYGAALKGEKLQVGHVHKAVGSGTKLHTHPNEQFSFVLEGTMLYEIEGARLEAPVNSVTHLPPGIVHGAIASAAGDVLTFVAKDTSHGMSGPPVDGVEDGPVYLPGFGPRKK